MELAAKLDDYGTPAWAAVTILALVIFWPLGLAILFYLWWSGRMGFWKHKGPGRWHHNGAARGRSCAARQRRRGGGQGSGNLAFDEYREETLRRLEDEQREFFDFLERLRHAKDKAEFDQFMSERRKPRGPDLPDSGNPAPQPQG